MDDERLLDEIGDGEGDYHAPVEDPYEGIPDVNLVLMRSGFAFLHNS
jgi:hypothetical protein